MEPQHIAYVLRPIIMFALFALVVIPLKFLLLKLIPEGKLKRLLLWRLHK